MAEGVFRVLHWGPLVALAIISLVTVTGTYCALQLWSLPRAPLFRWPNFVLMYTWLGLIIKNFVQALAGPGYVPRGWKPAVKSDEQYLQYCHECQGFKPPRAHHCRQCGRCIKKMDHHCPWVNSCVGHGNHAAFTRFTFYVPFGCAHGTLLNVAFIYKLLQYEFMYNRPFFPITSFWLVFSVAGIGLAIGTTIGVFLLFAFQLKSICLNCTQIEEWIIDKANKRRVKDDEPFIFPYDLGRWRNFTQVINLSGVSRGDGIEWAVREGCNKYAFTIEQLEQKKEKKMRTVTCRIGHGYAGSSCPASFGLATCLCRPCCSEGTVAVTTDDVMAVTRWQAYWVYGERVLSKGEGEEAVRVKGWFPRRCLAVQEVSSKRSGASSAKPKRD